MGGQPLDLALMAVTLLAVIGYVFWPLLRANLADDGWVAVPREAVSLERRALEERRDAALRILRDLDADREVMRITDEDYEADRARAVAEAARCLQELEEPAGGEKKS